MITDYVELEKKYIFEFLNYSKYNKNSLSNYPIKFPSLRRYLEKFFL